MSWDDEWGKDQIPYGTPLPKSGEKYPNGDKRLAPPSAWQEHKKEKTYANQAKSYAKQEKSRKRYERKVKFKATMVMLGIAILVIVGLVIIITRILNGEPLFGPDVDRLKDIGH